MGSNDRPDVVVAGGGVAGLAAAICLSRRGLRVVCIDPEPPPRIRVGESLDWSAPALLGEIGLDRDDLIAAGAGTFKREIRAATPTGELMVGRPWKWLQRWPLRFEEMTLHVDRGGFDLLLQKQALSVGVELVIDNVVGVRFGGDRINSFVTSSGERFEAAWFIDASGRRRLIGRSAGINRRKWGSPLMALWTESAAPSLDFDGTMLYLDDRGEALVWGWEIPIAQDRRSTGVVIPLNGFQALHRAGRTAGEILADHLAVLRPSPATSFAHNESVRTRSYQPYVYERVSGENWAMIGEAAAFADPLTSNGVTAALRHATEIAAVIAADADMPGRVPARLHRFDKRSRRLAHIYNHGIESLMYEPRIRRTMGIRWAARAYVPVGYFANSIYSRIRPTTRARSAAFAPFRWLFGAWTGVWPIAAGMSRLLPRRKSEKSGPEHGDVR